MSRMTRALRWTIGFSGAIVRPIYVERGIPPVE
jgi:hypothetical protein